MTQLVASLAASAKRPGKWDQTLIILNPEDHRHGTKFNISTLLIKDLKIKQG